MTEFKTPRAFLAAFACALLSSAVLAGSAEADFNIVSFGGGTFNQDGSTASQASSHPFAASTTIKFPLTDKPLTTDGQVKEVQVDLPPGFIGNPASTPTRCTPEKLEEQIAFADCPSSSQVGLVSLSKASFFPPGMSIPLSGVSSANSIPLWNLEAPPGYPAMFGFKVAAVSAFLLPSVRTGGDYGITVRAPEIAQLIALTEASVTIWGVPGDPGHDADRFPCITVNSDPSDLCPAGFLPKAFLTAPANCSAGPLSTTARARSWDRPDDLKTASFSEDTNGNPTAVVGCDRVPFQPKISIEPSNRDADSSTGLDVGITVPQGGLEDPLGIAQAPLKRAVVTLPEGISVNPSSADGLGACTASQIGLIKAGPNPQFTPAPANCPDSAKIGTLEVQTPLLDEPLDGAVYLGAQDNSGTAGDENPFGSLLSLYLAVDDPQTGIVLKLPGRVDPDPVSGRLRAVFDNNPQVPFSSLQLHFKTGARAPLITPSACGSYGIVSRFSPWSAVDPDNPTEDEIVTRTSAFNVASGPNGGPCPSGGIDPSFEAGTTTPIAGAYSPLVVNASRPDGSQPLAGLRLNLPEGLLGKLAGVPYCPEAGIAQASARNQPGQGALELASPSCPSASQVGTVEVGAGAGSNPFHVQGKAYLAGPYKGAPLSLLVITPALAGPFDLGAVAVRAALQVDPATAQITAISDPIPQILHGIPLKVRSISVNTDRPNFTLNPTSCNPMAFSGALFGGSAVAPVSSRFQVGACKALDFKPKLSLKLSGPTGRSKNPALKAVLTQAPGQANIDRVSVVLPKSAFIDNAHISNPCTRAQFNAGACPPKSILGHARAFTPLLDKPLEGPVYFRSNGGERELPDLVADLNGQVHFTLVGYIDSVSRKGSETSRVRNTFAIVPDAPVSKFVLNLKGGKVGLIENSANLCKSDQHASIKMDAQNGKTYDTSPVVGVSCGKSKSERER